MKKKHCEIALSLKLTKNEPVDYRAYFATMAEAQECAYEGLACYVKETKKYYVFLLDENTNQLRNNFV